ncbi:MAG: hypothetical protein Q9216_004480 [Gyalolechia sp. 2 TL-2023]
MARNSSESLPFDPAVLGHLSNSLTPLHSPSTSYLLSTSQTQHPLTTTHTRNWQPLGDPASSCSIPGNYSVPEAGTPRSIDLRNDTPTPAEVTPGSWRKRRRTGELVERPPKIRLNPPGSTCSMSPDIQSFPGEELASTGGPGSEAEHSHMTPPEQPSGPYTAARGVQDSSSSSSSAHDTVPRPSRSQPDDPLPPPAAKVATHHNQLDGTADEREPRRPLQPLASSEKLRESLREIPAQLEDLSIKDKPSDGDGDDSTDNGASSSLEAIRPSSTRQTQDNEAATWWSKTMRRLRKRGAPEEKSKNKKKKSSTFSKAGQHKSGRNSLRHLFSSSRGSSDDAAFPAVTSPFDNPAASPQGFAAPTHEEDTLNSPTEPDF